MDTIKPIFIVPGVVLITCGAMHEYIGMLGQQIDCDLYSELRFHCNLIHHWLTSHRIHRLFLPWLSLKISSFTNDIESLYISSLARFIGLEVSSSKTSKEILSLAAAADTEY